MDLHDADPGDGFLEVWLLDAKTGGMVSLGVLDGDRGSYAVPAGPRPDGVRPGRRLPRALRRQPGALEGQPGPRPGPLTGSVLRVRRRGPGAYAGSDMPDAPDTLPAVQTVYLDHAATTPMLPAALEVMTTHLRDVGNPSSLHASGRAARRVVEESRETIAQAINCRPGEVVFTSGGTESDNLALKGLFWSRRDADPARVRILASVDRAPRRPRRPALARAGGARRRRAPAGRPSRPPRPRLPSARPSSATRRPSP